MAREQWDRSRVTDILGMYGSLARYVDQASFTDAGVIGSFTVRPEDASSLFTSKAGLLNTIYNLSNTSPTGVLSATSEHSAGHFQPEVGIELFPGWGVVSAAIETASRNIEIQQLESRGMTNRVRHILGPIRFSTFIKPGDKISITPSNYAPRKVQPQNPLSELVLNSDVTVFTEKEEKKDIATIKGIEHSVEKPDLHSQDKHQHLNPARIIEIAGQTLGLEAFRQLQRLGYTQPVPILTGVEGPIQFPEEAVVGDQLQIYGKITHLDRRSFTGNAWVFNHGNLIASVSGLQCLIIRDRQTAKRVLQAQMQRNR